MTRLLSPVLFVLFTVCANAQELTQVILSGGNSLSGFSFITDQKVVIRISAKGDLIEWGTDPGTGRYNYYSGKLQPFMGRVDYYDKTEFDSLIRGKVKSIGTCTITYYGSSEERTRSGKIKSIGSVPLDYYNNFENDGLKGKLRSAGATAIDYYTSFDNEAFRGNLKSLGNTSLTYYSTFDDKLIRGRVKTIGSFSYTWYTSHDGSQFQSGGLKSGPVAENINGVTYLIR